MYWGVYTAIRVERWSKGEKKSRFILDLCKKRRDFESIARETIATCGNIFVYLATSAKFNYLG